MLTKGGTLVVTECTTPEPGLHEVLIEVQAVALNPIDVSQQDRGLPPVPMYPAVIGCDAAGVVPKVGTHVSTVAPGTRFQKYALAQSEVQGAGRPLGFKTAPSAWTTLGIPLETRYVLQDEHGSARTLGFTIYATASTKHHAYLRSLGADAASDFHDSDVVAQIVTAVGKEGIELRTAHCVVPRGLQPMPEVLKQTKGNAAARVAHSPVLLPGHPTLDNTEVKFNLPPLDQAGRDKHMHQCFHGWLREGLESGSVVPSPRVQVEGGGLAGLNAAHNKLKAGVSGVKVVVRI
ncbi:quinone reductase [Parathielavia appendiculata]|uniref:Quinone reductase n=1 Tax=Parathielavia appendiculata TaxID=2587402 RepID=A0AAN6U9C7_9PEZI|nr:quinone reductase [Parathielavia appendiculata]